MTIIRILLCYLDYLFGLLRGDLGEVNGSPILGIVQSASLNSLLLLVISLLIIIFAGPVLGLGNWTKSPP